jgi:nitroreductase
MVRSYDEQRPVHPDVVEQLLSAALRAPSAGFSQGWGFLVLNSREDVARFRTAVTPERDAEHWFAAHVQAPVIIVPHANKNVYIDGYAAKGLPRDEAWWPAPYWDIDAGFASLLILLAAVDEGLGACFFGIPRERIDAYKKAFAVPADLRPIGAISIGYPAEPPTNLRRRRRRVSEVVHYGHWNSSS